MSPSLRALAGLAVVLLGTIAAPLDSAVNIAFPQMTAYFAGDVHGIRWVVISYVLTYSSLLLVFGRLGDLVGYRIVFQAGLLGAFCGFLACAWANTFAMLLIGRVVQGVGVALILSCAPALVTTLYAEEHRTRMLGVYAGLTALGGALGPLAGGVLVERWGWDAVFWARAPLVAAALALTWLIPARAPVGVAKAIDFNGSVLLVAALASISLGLTLGSGSHGVAWLSGLGTIGVALLVAFVRQQAGRREPIIRPALFREPAFCLNNAANVVANFAAFSVVLIGPYYLIGVARLDVWIAGSVLALGAIGTILGSAIAPAAIRVLGDKGTVLAGLGLGAVGLAGIAVLAAPGEVAGILPPLVVQGVGLGLLQVATSDRVIAALPVGERGVAGSLTMLTRTFGIIAGAAGHTALHRAIEATALAGGAAPAEAFMAGMRAVFLGAAASLAIALLIGAAAARCRRG